MPKKFNFFIISIILLFAIFPLISAVKPISSIPVSEGYAIEPVGKSAIRTGIDHEFEIHVFNISNGRPITSGISCYMHLYQEDGNHVYEGYDDVVNHDFDYAFDLNGTNFTQRGSYTAKFQCNSSALGGGTEIFFIVNDYGEELQTAHSIKFNFAMAFMMILFLLALGGVVGIQNPIGKFACYWIAHILFVIGTFSMWQFNMGYTTIYVGLAGVWKIMFYVGIVSMLPMMIMSIAMLITYFSTTKEMTRLMDKGMSEAEAYRRQGRRYK